ncbi:MAG: homoserine O-acetyltransferase [Acidobacteriota bacterium]|jgi:homoserine O-acetyltransferase
MSSKNSSIPARPLPPDQVRVERVRAFDLHEPLRLESGAELGDVHVQLETYGRLDPSGANAILVCHALTGDAHAATHGQEGTTGARAGRNGVREGWWAGLIGPGRPLDPDRHFIVCTNILGSCFGSTGPASLDPETGRPYGKDFPRVTVRDMVRVQHRVLEILGVKRLALVLGGSLGGMQALEWAVTYPDWVRALAPIATASQHSPWAIALNALSRLSIMSDPEWNDGSYRVQPARGLSLARMVAMVSYRHYEDFRHRFGREQVEPGRRKRFDNPFEMPDGSFQVEQYLQYQGSKLVARFDANSYLCLSRAMDEHDLARGRGSLPDVLASIRAPTLCVGIDTDLLYPVEEQQEICRHIPPAVYREIRSSKGHDGFLVELEQLGEILDDFFESADVD